MNKNLRKLILPLTLLVSSQLYALGLGTIQVNSALDEELDGKISLVLDGGEDVENMTVSLASHADYERVGLDKSYVPSNIQVNLVDEDDQKYIKISSKGPISEPIVSLLLVVDWANGHLLREYTLLLDPPLFNNTQVQQNYSEPVQTQTYEAPKQIESTKQQVTPRTTTIANSSFATSNQVVVEAGDTLWEIASRHNNGFGSSQQMMVAIFNNNPPAFYNDDMNLIRKGAILDIPSADQVAMISNGQAISEVKSHIQNWSRLQTGYDGANDSGSQSSIDYGIELVPPNDSDSSDSSNYSGSSNNRANAKTQAKLSQAQEELASSQLENDELTSRIEDLERIVEDQKIALSLKDTNLTQLQQQLTAEDNEDLASGTADDVWDTSIDSATEMEASSDEMLDDTVVSSEEMSDDTMSDDSMDADPVAIADINDTEVDSGYETNTEESNTIIDTPPAQATEPSLIDKVLDYKYEGLIGLGVLLLAILGFIFFKRRDNDDYEEAGGFLDTISNKSDRGSDTGSGAFDDDITELNLDNLDEDIGETDDLQDVDLDEEQPEVIVMDDQQGGDDFDIDEFDLDSDIEEDDLTILETEDSDDTELDIDNLGDTESVNQKEADDLDFDNLSLGDNQNNADKEVEVEEVEETEELKESEDFSLDFDLDDLELDDDLEMEDGSEDKDSAELLLEDDFSLDLDISDDQDLDDVVNDNEELEDLVFDTDERRVVSDTESNTDNDTSSADPEEDLEFDLSEDLFDTDDLLDFDGDTDEDTIEDVDIGLDFDDIIDDDAIDTKLDLAKAYFEMGDIDGAKQMVVEIIEEGNDEQKSKAQELKNEIESS